MMGKREKTNSVVFETHESLYNNVTPGVDIQIIENVTEYPYELVKKKLGPGWGSKSIQIDPRIFGLPAARTRRYVIAWKQATVEWSKDFCLNRMLDSITSQVRMDTLKYWWMRLGCSKLTPGEAAKLQFWVVSTRRLILSK